MYHPRLIAQRERMLLQQPGMRATFPTGVIPHYSLADSAVLTAGLIQTRALAGADVEDQASYLFSMVSRIYENLPWFLQPERTIMRTGKEMGFSNGSFIRTAWGKSTRGELQEITGRQKGHIGRGKTFSVVHISELSTWDNPGQLDDALLQAIPMSPLSLVI